MFIKREMSELLQKFSGMFPVVALLGPRQSGKTTLVQQIFHNYHYVNMESLDLREVATQDPRGFLEKLLSYSGVIIDEFQYVPSLISYLQVIVDREKRTGFFILTGSQNFLAHAAIGQSLAGRVGILTLLPLSLGELAQNGLLPNLSEPQIFQGFYPRIFENKQVQPEYLYSSYIQTYIERDVRTIIQVTDLALFKKFLGLCAGRVGQLLNISTLASDAGISVPTVNAWLSVLQASYILFLLQPHHQNFSKRLIKSPKLYFYDTGVVASLLGLDSAQQLEHHYLRGALFENMIIADFYKQFFNRGKTPAVYFWRDSHGHEVDCVIERGDLLLPIEIKASMTYQKSFLDGIAYWQELSGTSKGLLVYGGDQEFNVGNIEVQSWKRLRVL